MKKNRINILFFCVVFLGIAAAAPVRTEDIIPEENLPPSEEIIIQDETEPGESEEILPEEDEADTDATSTLPIADEEGEFAENTEPTEEESVVVIPPVDIAVRIEGPEAMILDLTLSVPESCDVLAINDTASTTMTGHKAICALQTLQDAGVLSYQTTRWGFGFSLDEVNSITNAADWSSTWIVYLNNMAANVGIADLGVANSDILLLTYGPWPSAPLALELSTSTAAFGDTVAVTAYSYDDSGSPLPFTGTTTFYSALFTTTTAGSFSWIVDTTSTGPVEFWAEALNMTRSRNQTLTLTASTTSENAEPPVNNDEEEDGENSPPSPSPAAPESVSNNTLQSAAANILSYLKGQQDTEGKIIDGATTDWIIMSLGANNEYAADITQGGVPLLDYALNYSVSAGGELNVCAGYPRHGLALLAAGISPAHTAMTDLMAAISSPSCYANQIYGQSGINDDVFALLFLLTAGTPNDSPIIQDIVSTIRLDQNGDGAFTWAGWPGADITGAALNALSYATQKGVAVPEDVFSRGRTYLKNTQLADGGWGFGTSSDVLTTSWAIMGIVARGEGQSAWFNGNGKNPWHPLVEQLQSGGYYESSFAPGPDWFGTKSAVPALLSKSWPIILTPRPTLLPTDTVQNPNSSPTPGALETPTTTPITILLPVTSTIATTTEQELIVLTEPEPLAESHRELLLEPDGTGGPEEAGEIVTALAIVPNEETPAETPVLPETIEPVETAIEPETELPIQTAARNVFGGAGAVSLTLGSYLAWRLLLALL